MTTQSRIAGGAIAFALACLSCSAHDDAAAKTAAAEHRFGWSHAVASYNTNLPVDTPIGNAPQPVMGHELREIVSDESVRVRADGMACVGCHAWAKSVDRATFCNTHVDAFVAQPTANAGGNDPPNAKPWLLKQLFAAWKAEGCPD